MDPKSMVEEVCGDWFDVDAIVYPNEMELRVLRYSNSPTTYKLMVESRNMVTSLGRHKPEVRGKYVKLWG